MSSNPLNAFSEATKTSLIIFVSLHKTRTNKTKVAFWIVSDCDTPNQREKYGKKLKEYIDIDVFSRVSLNVKLNHIGTWSSNYTHTNCNEMNKIKFENTCLIKCRRQRSLKIFQIVQKSPANHYSWCGHTWLECLRKFISGWIFETLC